MAREHVREAVVLASAAFPKVFTLKELVRRGEAIGPRGADESLADWLARAHAGRTSADLMGNSDADDIADPIGMPRSAYQRMVEGARRPARPAGRPHLGAPLRRRAPVSFDEVFDNREIFDDTELFDVIRREKERQNTTVQLIASENFTSPAVMAAPGSVLTNKYSEGYPGQRYYGGNYVIDEVEDLARDRAKALFGADHANVQPHSGANANMAVYLALLQPGDTVLGMRLDHGGHLTHGSPVNISGRLYNFVSYGVTESDERLDYDQIRDLAKEHRPKVIVAGATAYPRVIDPEPLRAIADEVGALLIFDAAHIAGLIAGGAHPNPVPFSDVVTFTTHKTLRGPRAGCILAKAEHAAAIDKAVFPGLQGGPLEHVIAAKAVAFREAAQPAFRDYAARIVTNAPALAGPWRGRGSASSRAAPTTTSCWSTCGPSTPSSPARRRRTSSTGPGSPSTRTRSPTTPGRRSSPAACASAPPPSPPQGWASRRWPRSRPSSAAPSVNVSDEGAVAGVREAVATLCSKFTPYPDE